MLCPTRFLLHLFLKCYGWIRACQVQRCHCSSPEPELRVCCALAFFFCSKLQQHTQYLHTHSSKGISMQTPTLPSCSPPTTFFLRSVLEGRFPLFVAGHARETENLAGCRQHCPELEQILLQSYTEVSSFLAEVDFTCLFPHGRRL